jgi:hypothetical protein
MSSCRSAVHRNEANMLKQLKHAASSSILETHPHYRTAIGALGVSLPPILMLASWLGFLQTREFQTSISAYYWAGMRDWFVGTLFVIGVFLFFYQYTPRNQGDEARTRFTAVRMGRADAWLGKIAGVCAVLVALLPTRPPASTAQPPTIGMIHGAAAGVLFTCLALFPLLLFSQSKKRAATYKLYGWAMIAGLVLVVVYQFAPEGVRKALAPAKPILVLETFLILVFGASWFEKGRELANLPRRKWTPSR